MQYKLDISGQTRGTLGHVLINLVDGRKISVNMVARSALFQTKYI